MDPDLLRLILLAVGVTLVVGIYLADRYRRLRARLPQKPLPLKPDMAADEDLNELADDDSSLLDEDSGLVDVPSLSMKDEEHEPLRLSEWDEVRDEAPDVLDDEQHELDFEFNALDDSDYLHANTSDEDVPKLILQIGITPRSGQPFTGDQVLAAAQAVELKHGEMDIFHRHDGRARRLVLYSMASMVEPGTFPIRKMADYSTPGLILFTQLPGPRDGLAIYSDMLFTAERLSSLLDADLKDESHSALSKQTIEHTRERIIDHRRKLTLARRKV